jgi:hypothetical protein
MEFIMPPKAQTQETTQTPPAPPAPPAPNPVEAAFFVQDILARDTPRTHEFLNEEGDVVNFTFKPGERIDMPAYLVRKYIIKNPETFKVTNVDGDIYRLRDLEQNQASIILAVDEVVAKLDWLKKAALLNVAEQRNVVVETGDKEETIITKIIIAVNNPKPSASSEDDDLEFDNDAIA